VYRREIAILGFPFVNVRQSGVGRAEVDANLHTLPAYPLSFALQACPESGAKSASFGMRLNFTLLLLTGVISMAHATTVTIGGATLTNQGQVTSVAGTTTVDFNSLPTGGPQTLIAGIATFSNLNIRAAGGTDIASDTSLFSDPFVGVGDETISFAQPINYFGLYWGSPDPLNLITFFNGATAVFTFTGQQLHDQLGVAFGSGNAAFVNFTAGAGETYTRIVLSPNASFPFENDNNAFRAATAAPEPATFLCWAAGFVLIALARRAPSPRRVSASRQGSLLPDSAPPL